jgi:tRNA A37 threonylcarbamoyladenosine synthetase subunit TsaC/SUA5/YrdC
MAQFIKNIEDKPNEAAIAKVVKVLKGGLVIYPTDFTVWGVILQILKALENC